MQYSQLLQRLISNGTTTAMIFGSLHLEPSMLLADTLHQVRRCTAVLHNPHPSVASRNQDSIIALEWGLRCTSMLVRCKMAVQGSASTPILCS